MKNNIRRTLTITILGVALLFISLLGGILYYLFQPRLTNTTETVYYVLKPGSTAQRLAYDLAKLKIINHPKLLIFILTLEGRLGHLQSGEYELTTGISLQAIINKISRGDIAKHQVTFVDGWTFKQIFAMLEENPYLQHTLKGKSPSEVAALLKLDHANPEGLFLPETYQFNWPASDADILLRAHKALQIVLNAEWQTRTTGKVYRSPYQALVAASLIEKESADQAELNKISGVIYRRLQKGMRLQIDPTVIYGLGDRYQGKLHRADLKVDSPYNTYRYYGLPPTPIALPSAKSIHAALHPNEGDELYFVAKGDGSHYFSTDLKTHDRAILKYLLADKK